VNTPAATAKAVRCPSCGGSITLRALGHSVMAACPSCGTQIDVSQPEIKLIEKYQQTIGRLQVPLGARGALRGQMYEVVGAMQRVVSGYHWQEFLLFNPYVGFRWLVYDSGHWNFGEMIKDVANIKYGDQLEYRGDHYRLFQSGKPSVEWVVGEFYWRVTAGDTVTSRDYVAPPFMMSLEKADGESTWTRLEYLEPKEIEAAFHCNVGSRSGVAPNQINPANASLRAILPLLLLALAGLIAIQAETVMMSRDSEITVGKYYFGQGHPEQQVFGPFKLDSPSSLNELRTYTSLDNSWVELRFSLVNTATGQNIDFTNARSFYHGTDSDGVWSESEGDADSLIASVPAGEYNLVVEGTTGGDAGQIVDGTNLALRHDVAPWRNFWIGVAAVLLYPLRLLWRRSRFETERWSNSDED
jgi:predicted RNA-binding Zn-ribbon protein involved in translation (DUF1610 family)